jgi:hypothetical protein
MKKILLDTLIMILTGIVSGIGFIALTIALNMDTKNYFVFIPALITSWIIIYPSYVFWSDLFKKILKYD